MIEESKEKPKELAKDLESYMSGAGEAVIRQEQAPLFFNNQLLFRSILLLLLPSFWAYFMLQFNGSETLRDWVYGETSIRPEAFTA